MQEQVKKKRLVILINRVVKFYRWLLSIRLQLNRRMDGHYTPRRVALITSFAVGLICIIMLFVPPYRGVADDGSLYQVMNHAGISYEQKNPEAIYNNYFIKKYEINGNNFFRQKFTRNSQDYLILGAITLDELIHKDQSFDIRYLAFIYVLLYLPAIYLLVKNICQRLYFFSEAFVVGFLSVIVFADVSYVTYFNSLYPEALWMICFLYCTGAICRLHYHRTSYFSLLLITIFGVILTTSRQQCSVIGFLLAAFCLKTSFMNRKVPWILSCLALTFLFNIAGITSFNTLDSDFTITSKYHAMTRGVLFQAADPEEALKELGINRSYAVLTDTSAYDYYPFVLPDSDQLKNGFYDRYDAIDIGVYYIKHPTALFRMLDLGIKGTINLRRNFCGNFEQSAGMPKMSQSIFWAGWSIFKESSAPKTIGFLIILLLLSYLLYGRRKASGNRREREENSQVMYDLILLIFSIGISQVLISIIMSGDAEFTRHGFLLGAAMDMILYLIITEGLPKMKIIQEEASER